MSCILIMLKCHLLIRKRERDNSKTLMKLLICIILSINLLCRYNLYLNITRCHDTIAVIKLYTIRRRTRSCNPLNLRIKETNISRVTINNECHVFKLCCITNICNDTINLELKHLLNILNRKSCCNRCGVGIEDSLRNPTTETKNIILRNLYTLIEIKLLIEPCQYLTILHLDKII